MLIPSHLAQRNGLADEIWRMGFFVWEAGRPPPYIPELGAEAAASEE